MDVCQLLLLLLLIPVVLKIENYFKFFPPPEDLQVGHELNGFNLTTEKQL